MADYAKEFENQMFGSFQKGQQRGDGQIIVPKIVVCPAVFKKPCRLCELCRQTFKSAKGTPLEEKASNYYRKFRYYSNILFPAINPSEVVVFEYGKKILEKLMGYHMDPNSEYKGFLDPRTGRNLVLIRRVNTTDKKKTSYDVEPRIQATPLLDMSVLTKLALPQYQLHQILESIESKLVTPFYQSKLEQERTEVRFLPSWFGPQYSIFYTEVMYHYGFTKDEFEAIQRGEFNPFLEDSKSEPKHETVWSPVGLEPSLPTKPAQSGGGQGWGTVIQPDPPTKLVLPAQGTATVTTPKSDGVFPNCYGKEFDSEDPECVTDCAKDGWSAGCKLATEAAERRKTAKRLFKYE